MTGTGPLRILMTADAVGGVWQYALTLAHEYGLRGHHTALALLGPGASPEQREHASAIAGLRLIETGLPLDWIAHGPEPTIRAARDLRALAGEVAADVVHCNSPVLVGDAGFPMPVVAVAHGCVGTWWRAARATPLAAEFEWHARMTAAGLAAADAVAAPSASFADALQETYGLRRAPVVIHNGRPAPETATGALQLDIGLTAGRLWDTVKGAEVLDRAAALVDTPIVAAGALRGPNGEEFSPAHLQALGHQSEASLRRLFGMRPVFLSAARFEPFGLAVLEAASAGCALVLADIATFRELWDGAAEFVPVSDEAAYARALQSLIHDRDRRNALGDAARRRSRSYTPAAMAAATLDLYRQVLPRADVAA